MNKVVHKCFLTNLLEIFLIFFLKFLKIGQLFFHFLCVACNHYISIKIQLCCNVKINVFAEKKLMKSEAARKFEFKKETLSRISMYWCRRWASSYTNDVKYQTMHFIHKTQKQLDSRTTLTTKSKCLRIPIKCRAQPHPRIQSFSV